MRQLSSPPSEDRSELRLCVATIGMSRACRDSANAPRARSSGLLRSEVPLGEGAPRASLQVLLEPDRRRRVRELQRDDKGPGPMMDGHTRWTGVVPFEASFNVTRDADVVAIGVRVAAEDVDEAPLVHAGGEAGTMPEQSESNLAEK